MTLTFPTRPATFHNGMVSHPGEPIRATHCHCTEGAFVILDRDTCLRCGHYTHTTITRTWADRAATIATRARVPARAAA